MVRRVLKALIIFGGLFSIVNVLSTSSLLDENGNYSQLLLSITLIGISTVVFASISRALFTNLIESMERKEKDITKYTFLRAIIEAFIYFLGLMAIFLSVPGTEKFAKTILSGAGIIALVAGLAAQETVGNVLAGVFIIFSKPFKIGDTIQVEQNMMGTVWDISLRHTIIKDYDNKMIVIPNSIINKEKLFNYNLGDERACRKIDFEIAYNSDYDKAKRIVAEEVENHKYSIDVRDYEQLQNNAPRVTTRIDRLEESGVIVRVWAWTEKFEYSYELKCDVTESVLKRFHEEGIDIPFPHRTVVMRKEES